MTVTSITVTPYNPPLEEKKSILSEIIHKVQKIAHAVFKFITFPFRYFGSKTWSVPGVALRFPCELVKRVFTRKPFDSLKQDLFGSGYHYNMEKELSPEESESYLPYVCAHAAVHKNDPSWVECFGWKEQTENCFFDEKTGLKIGVFEKEGEIMVAFGALHSYESNFTEGDKRIGKMFRKSILNIVANFVGGNPKIYKQANEWFQNFTQGMAKNITLCGQCYGGSIASYIGLKNSVPAVCFNTFPLGVGLQHDIGLKQLKNADSLVTHISANHDLVSHPPLLGIIDRIASAVGLRTPGNFGRRYKIPSAYKSIFGTHSFFLGSMMKHLGYDKKAKPQDIWKSA